MSASALLWGLSRHDEFSSHHHERRVGASFACAPRDQRKPDEADEVPELDRTSPAISRAGDFWRIGNHRLLCGDSLNKSHHERLLGSTKAQMELGHHVVAEAGRLEEAMTLARTAEFDLAVLDININGDTSAEVAALIVKRQLPFILTRMYGPAAFRKRDCAWFAEVADMYPACLIGSRAVALMGIRTHLWSH